jgi:hypothetical protein
MVTERRRGTTPDTIAGMSEAVSGSSSVEPQRNGADATADMQRLYDEQYYVRDYTVPYQRNDHWTAFFGGIANRIVADFHPVSVLDAGCALGLLVEQLVDRGVDASGVDISTYAVANAPEPIRDRLHVGSLTEPLPKHYDLITCIEVIEHLPVEDGRRALANLCEATDRILFSSIPDGYEEPTHVNVQPPEAWSALFAERSFFRAVEYDASYVSPWAALYERREPRLPDLVREYDRVYARLRNEVHQLREGILRLSEREDQGQAAAEEVGRLQVQVAAFEGQVAQLREQVLSMRDVIIGLETANGDIAAEREWYEAQFRAHEGVAKVLEEVLESRTWRTTWKLMAPYRQARRVFGR